MSASSRLPALAVCLGALAVLTGCSREPEEGVVARIDDRAVFVAEVEAYLAVNLDDEWGEEALSGAELDLVRSRLFDAFLEERILLHEADRQGIEAGEEEVRAFLRAGAHRLDPIAAEAAGEEPPAAPSARAIDTARRSLRIQRLIDRTARGAAEIDDAEIDAWIRQRQGSESTASGRVVLRSLLMPSLEDAERAHREVGRRRMTFDEVVALHEPTPGQAAPSELSVDDLPPVVAEAIADVDEGRIARPVEVHGEVFLFQVVHRGAARDPRDDEAERVRAARELQDRHYLQASRRLLDDLRETLEIHVYPDQLPFPYVPDRNVPDAGREPPELAGSGSAG